MNSFINAGMQSFRYKSVILSIVFLYAGLTASGYDFIFKKYHVNNGLSENTVQAIIQDRQGYMWFGTKDGLNRFDGNEYRVFRNISSDLTTIGNNFIRTIYEDTDGKLWVGTDNKLYIYNPATEKFTLFDATTPDGTGINSSVAAICAENENTIWIGCMYEGVFRYQKKENRLEHFSNNGSHTSLSSNMVWRIYKDYSGTIWIGTRDGLNRFNPETGGFQSYRPQNSSNTLGFNDILAISEDSDGDLWLGTWSGGLSKLDKVTNTFKTYFDKGKSSYITKIRAIFEYEKNTLLIGADDGLYMFNKQTLDYHRIDDPKDPNSLSDQNVYSIYRDRENGIWIGTYFGGVNYVSSKNHMIEHYYPGYSDNSLSGKAVSQFCEDEKENLWIATEDGGLNYFDTKTKKFRIYKPQEGKPGLSYHNLHSVVLDGENLWIGTFSRGVDVLNTRTNTFRNYQFQMDNPNSIDDNCVFSIYRNKKGEIFVGTPFGLSKFNPAHDNFTRINQVRGFIYDMQEDHHGSFWVATYGSGLFRLDPGSNSWKNYHFTSGTKNSLSYDKVVDAFLDEKQRLWFATEGGGICKYNYDTDDFTTIDEASGLPNNVAYGILDDKYGNIWVSTNHGITRINPESLEMKTYTKEDGLQSNQFNYRSSYKARNGIFYFGGINGFNAFNPDNLQDNPYVPPVAITRFELLDEDNSLPVDTTWKSNLIKRKKIVLKHNQASFRLGFVSMSYQATEKNRYTCIMEGLENKWRSVGNQKSLTYINLAPGEYVFRVKGSNNDGVWNDTGDYLEIQILPPFWKSGVAYLIYSIFLLSVLFYGGRTVYRRQHARQKKRLEDFRLEKEKEMFDSKINFFTNVAHEIRTPVSLIKAPLECIVNNGEHSPETKENLDVIARNSDRLLDLVNQLLDFRKVEEDRYRFQFVKTDVNQLLTDAYFRFKTTAGQYKIDFQLHLPEKAVSAIIDREAVTKIISNLLTNALKFSLHKVDIFLSEVPEKEMMELSVTDDGPGIEQEFREKVFEPFYQVMNADFAPKIGGTGIGLALSRQLAERHNGKIFFDHDFVGGSRFVVQLPTNLDISLEKEAEEQAADDNSNVPYKIISHHSADKLYLLVVEDNEELKTFLEKNLRQDYNVLVAGNGLEAIKILKEFSVDLIISDIVMPGMDGLELAKTIKQNEQYSHIPIILLSARTNTQSKIEGLEFGADSYIEKPFSIGFLKAQVSSLIENRMRVLEKFSKSPFVSYGTIASNKRDEDFLARLNAEIEKNISDVDFSIEKLALSLSISRSNLQRKIRGISRMAPNDYIRIYRLKKAARLLLQGDYRINEICFLVGFNSPSYFARCFQKQFGVLPKEFIKNNEQEVQHPDK